jgi:hypothetical protein
LKPSISPDFFPAAVVSRSKTTIAARHIRHTPAAKRMITSQIEFENFCEPLFSTSEFRRFVARALVRAASTLMSALVCEDAATIGVELKKEGPAKVRDCLDPAAAGLMEGVLLKRTTF